MKYERGRDWVGEKRGMMSGPSSCDCGPEYDAKARVYGGGKVLVTGVVWWECACIVVGFGA